MGMKTYITSELYGGIDWHDSCSHMKQLSYNGQYAMDASNIDDVITDDIMQEFPYLKREVVIDALKEGKTFTFPILDKVEVNDGETYVKPKKEFDCYEKEATINGKDKTVNMSYAFGQATYDLRYYIEEHDEDKVMYVVGEHFLAPWKGCPLVERIYRDLFSNLEEAQKYYDELKLHENSRSEKCIMVADPTILDTDWYKKNKQALELMEQKGATPYDDTFRISVTTHIKALEEINEVA